MAFGIVDCDVGAQLDCAVERIPTREEQWKVEYPAGGKRKALLALAKQIESKVARVDSPKLNLGIVVGIEAINTGIDLIREWQTRHRVCLGRRSFQYLVLFAAQIIASNEAN